MVVLPEGCEITLVGPVAGHPEMFEVSWNGQSVWIFAIDFEARTKFESPSSDETPPLVSTEQKTAPAPRVRRFNAAGRELF